MTTDKVPEKRYGGDLFTTNCEEGRHAWRPQYGADQSTIIFYACKWCDKPREVGFRRLPTA